MPTADADRLRELLNQAGGHHRLSVRASNCLKAAKIRTIGTSSAKRTNELDSYKNFGKKSLDDQERLTELKGLSLGMDVPGRSPAAPSKTISKGAPMNSQ